MWNVRETVLGQYFIFIILTGSVWFVTTYLQHATENGIVAGFTCEHW